MIRLWGIVLGLLCASCATDPTPNLPSVRYAPSDTLEVATWGEVIEGAGYAPEQTTFVLLEPDSDRIRVYNPAQADSGTLPASTFKIVLTVLGVELGPLRDSSYTLSYDTLVRTGALMTGANRPEAQRDLCLAEAFRLSVPWYFQEVARQIGQKTMEAWLDSLNYGTGGIAAGVDRFWLEGGFRITPYQQVDFLYRLLNDQTPIACRPQEILRDIARMDSTPQYRLYGKTGWGIVEVQPGARMHIGWLVGWVELAKRTPKEKQRRVYYALRMRMPDPLPPTWATDRRLLTEELLRSAGTFSNQ